MFEQDCWWSWWNNKLGSFELEPITDPKLIKQQELLSQTNEFLEEKRLKYFSELDNPVVPKHSYINYIKDFFKQQEEKCDYEIDLEKLWLRQRPLFNEITQFENILTRINNKDLTIDNPMKNIDQIALQGSDEEIEKKKEVYEEVINAFRKKYGTPSETDDISTLRNNITEISTNENPVELLKTTLINLGFNDGIIVETNPEQVLIYLQEMLKKLVKMSNREYKFYINNEIIQLQQKIQQQQFNITKKYITKTTIQEFMNRIIDERLMGETSYKAFLTTITEIVYKRIANNLEKRAEYNASLNISKKIVKKIATENTITGTNINVFNETSTITSNINITKEEIKYEENKSMNTLISYFSEKAAEITEKIRQELISKSESARTAIETANSQFSEIKEFSEIRTRLGVAAVSTMVGFVIQNYGSITEFSKSMVPDNQDLIDCIKNYEVIVQLMSVIIIAPIVLKKIFPQLNKELISNIITVLQILIIGSTIIIGTQSISLKILFNVPKAEDYYPQDCGGVFSSEKRKACENGPYYIGMAEYYSMKPLIAGSNLGLSFIYESYRLLTNGCGRPIVLLELASLTIGMCHSASVSYNRLKKIKTQMVNDLTNKLKEYVFKGVEEIPFTASTEPDQIDSNIIDIWNKNATLAQSTLGLQIATQSALAQTATAVQGQQNLQNQQQRAYVPGSVKPSPDDTSEEEKRGSDENNDINPDLW